MEKIVSFIILHYIVIEETIACVESIKKMNMQDNIKIVIVDNASPNDSGKELQKKYEKDSQVHIVLNGENEGFSRGNNIGCLYAKKQWNPFFYVVTNNDVIFEQKEFCEKLFAQFQKKEFYVLGMDIFCPHKGVHQSPLTKRIPDRRNVNKTILINKIMLQFFGILYPIIKWYYGKIDRGGHDAIDYDKYQENVCIMGACIVLSCQYMAKREKPFYPETRFYYEEFLISLWCERHEARIIYQPDIKVIHNEGTATNQVSSQYRKKVKFRMRNIVDSAGVFKEELKNCKKDISHE